MGRTLCTLVCALSLLAMLPAVPQSQEPAAREVTVSFAALSRGYARPLRKTAHRLAQVPGISEATAIGASADYTQFRVMTTLEPKGLANALGGVLLFSEEGRVVIAPVDDARAKRAEARHGIDRIMRAILTKPRPSWRGGTSPGLLADADEIDEKLKKLEVDYRLLNGGSYKHTDYHIEEMWGGSEATYRVWVGSPNWVGLSVETGYFYGWEEPSDENEEAEEIPATFAGGLLQRGYQGDNFFWADSEGALLSGALGERAKMVPKAEGGEMLMVQDGKIWLQSILGAVSAYRVRHPNETIKQMPRGRGWSALSKLDEYGNLHRWSDDGYNNQCLTLDWSTNDKKQFVARIRVFHEHHPLYLEANLNVDEVAQANKDIGGKDSLTTLDVKDKINWVVDAEDSLEVFEKRRANAVRRMDNLRELMVKAAETHPLDQLCGNLGDEALRERIGIKFDEGEDLAPGAYTIRRQIMGDVEITVGSPRTGGMRWMLFNVKSGDVIRRYQ